MNIIDQAKKKRQSVLLSGRKKIITTDSFQIIWVENNFIREIEIH